MTKRVVSKRTKRLFIGFGAVGIATACIIPTAKIAGPKAATPRPGAVMGPTPVSQVVQSAK